MGVKRSLRTQPYLAIKIILIYSVIAILSGAISYSVYKSGNSISYVNQQLLEKQLPLLNQLSELKHWITEQERILYEHYAEFDKNKNEPSLILANQNIQLSLSKLKQFYPNNITLEKISLLNEHIVRASSELVLVLDSNDQSRWDEARELLASVSRMGRNTKPHISILKDQINKEIAASNYESSNQLQKMTFWVGAFSIFIIFIALVIGYYVRTNNKRDFEKRKLALFIERNPNPVSSMDWNGNTNFKNHSWRNNFKSDKNKNFKSLLLENLSKLKDSGNNQLRWEYKSRNQYYEVELNRIKSLNQVIAYIEDTTERVSATRELEYLAFNDPLTGLGNLKKLEMDLEIQLKNGASNQFYLLAIGIKSLKLVTSTHGLSVSDALMKAVVIRLQKSFLPFNNQFSLCRLYRFTGAKFMLMLAQPLKPDSHDHVHRNLDHCLLKSMAKPLQTLFGSFFLDLQSGCVKHPEHGYSSSMLIKNANAALTESQKLNRNQLVMFDHEISYREQKWYQLENDLKTADFDEEFRLVYQPKINLQNGKMTSMEALIRWQHPNRGMISPAEFIPVAEANGTLLSLGHWVLCEACEQTKKWQLRGLSDLQVAVNVSPSQLLSANFTASVIKCLEDTGLDAQYLEIEITEEVLATEHETCFAVLDSLKQRGVSIAIDDFGTGYSSLSYLNKFPISKLKIDRSFVTEIQHNSNNHAIVSAIIALSHKLDIVVIAEGIETEEELSVLEKLHCQIGQGYHFSKPLEMQAFNDKYLSNDNILEMNRYS
ncbi:MAG: putative bifunctional diguanylate cyclase/phosphodiesterase [Kangiellaceae bacterium]